MHLCMCGAVSSQQAANKVGQDQFRHYISFAKTKVQSVDECPNETLQQTTPTMGLSDPPEDFILPADLFNYSGYTTNPYLSYRPVFARSLPIQILINGMTLTLVCILLIQLLFTAPYHIRLARVNFFLQLSAAVVLLASEIASLSLLLNDTMRQSQNWPFMLEYIAFDLPPLNDPRTEAGWSQGGLITWLLMNALVSALTQVRRPPHERLPISIHLHFL